jgi:glycosyltransferase involved in cell wall biosynthesis
MDTQPLFTIATITYNSEKWVKQAIESILTSSFTDFELLISDDCSTDNTWKIIKQYNHPKIKSWQNQVNLGEYPNRNKVLNEARGKYILFVDGDDVLYKNTLRNISEYLSEYPEAVSVWGVWSHQISFCIFPVLLQPIDTVQWIYGANLPIFIMGFAETVFKIETLRQVGGFSEKYICGDVYIKKRIALEGPVILIPIGLMFWRRTTGQATQRLNVALNGYKNNVFIDREILSNKFFNEKQKEYLLFEKNLNIRDIKLLFKYTFMKGKFFAGIRLWKIFGFSIGDLKYLFMKADFSYLDTLQRSLYNGNHKIIN